MGRALCRRRDHGRFGCLDAIVFVFAHVFLFVHMIVDLRVRLRDGTNTN
jgi:hypothetical protein